MINYNDDIDKLKSNTILCKFDSAFSNIKSKSIALYGTGKNARTILQNVTGYNFACLIAQNNFYDNVYGVKILPIEEALRIIDVIIIAAIPSSTSIIYNRIKDIVPENIPIYDLHGYLLRGDDIYKKNPYWNSCASDLIELIDSHDIISFDVFDTLVTRITLFPRDVFEHMNMGKEFIKMRINTEEKLYKKSENPSLTQIYDYMASENGWLPEKTVSIKEKEIVTEESLLVVRNVIYNLLKYALDSNKKIYLTSDMYLEKEVIYKLLSLVGINSELELVVSCDYAKTKESGDLYNIIIDKNPGKRILHIGDNWNADILNAEKKGIDAFYVKKGYDILAESACAYLFDLIHTNDDKDLLGYMISRVLNDPFRLSNTKGKMFIDNYDDIAVFVLPITLLFLKKILEWSNSYDEILFASRDGFFVCEIYEWYRKKNLYLNLPKGKYIYVSRSAISSMAVKTDKDIAVLTNKIVDDPKLNLKNFLENQFHILLPDEFDISTKDAVEKWSVEGILTKINLYYERIAENSHLSRERYLKYLKKEGIKTTGKIAIVDIVTQGTLVFGLSNIFDNKIDLISLGTSAIPNNYIDDISRVKSIYGNITEKVGDAIYSMSDFSELHLFLEMLYASKEGQFYTIDGDNNPVFVQASEYNPDLLENVQKRLSFLLEIFVKDKEIPAVSSDFALGMLRVFSKKFSTFSENLKNMFWFDDPYDGSIQKCNLIEFIQ